MEGDAAEIGLKFEKYVLPLFDLKIRNSSKDADYKIVSWTGDYSKNIGYSIETDSEPDLIIRHLESNIKIAIECKYRSHSIAGKISISKWFLDHYKEYADKNPDIPTYILYGLDGQPDNPDRMFCVPVNEIKYANSYISGFKNYERNPKDMFTFDPATKVLK